MVSKSQQPLQSLTREQFWQHHIKHWQDSGLSKMGYCRDNELPYHQLIYWCEKHRQPQSPVSPVGSNFIGVTLTPADSRSTGTLSVELPNGISITGVSAETIELVPLLLRSL